MKYKLSAKETAGVVAVGLATGEIARRVANSMKTDKSHQIAMLVGGATLYYAGVVIGSNRPETGFLGSSNVCCGNCGSTNIHNGSCNGCGSKKLIEQKCTDCGCTEIIDNVCMDCGCYN
jgi:hypothetical protein